ncbi:hypothetical protein ES332_A03G062500v1 [Gossypium tomentosum]|uniref:Uncharacterized protein n=1 Tax=Gossypium tomentosum TaxID=34277 RepID=A0A5D2R3I7_GOSTO|nr:hypothetical protein ES332_A03G062500v1 [Gossypium tomentosum]
MGHLQKVIAQLQTDFSQMDDKGKGIRGTPPPRFPPKDTLAVSPAPKLIYT